MKRWNRFTACEKSHGKIEIVVVVVVFVYVDFLAFIFLSFCRNSCGEVLWKKDVWKTFKINSKQIGVLTVFEKYLWIVHFWEGCSLPVTNFMIN